MSHGPWKVTRMGGYNIRVRCEEGMTQADAHLIAAAPDLLAALEDLMTYDETTAKSEEARAAIAKAKGTPQ